MAMTTITSRQIRDGGIYKEDLNTTITGKAVLTKVIAGTNITINSTGIDAGTGDVTIHSGSWNFVYTNDTLYDLSNMDYLVVDATAEMTYTLPSSPVEGHKIRIKDQGKSFSTYNCTLNRNTKLIEGIADNLTLDINGTTVELIYTDISTGWIINFC